MLVKGGPDVVLARCATVGAPMVSPAPIADGSQAIADANARLGAQGLRVLAFAARILEESDLATVESDAMSLVHDLTFVGDFPQNTSGGQLSSGQAGAAGGFIGMTETVRQLTGQAGARSVPGARTGLVGGFGMVTYDRCLCTGAVILEKADAS